MVAVEANVVDEEGFAAFVSTGSNAVDDTVDTNDEVEFVVNEVAVETISSEVEVVIDCWAVLNDVGDVD